MLSGCGFQPVYGFSEQRDDAAERLLSQVRVKLIANRIGQQMRNELLDRMNPSGQPAAPLYELSVTMSESQADLGIQRDDTATFAKQRVDANFKLTDIKTGKTLLNASSQSTNSYNILRSSPYATLQAEEDARRRAALEIADDITARVALFLKQYQSQSSSANNPKSVDEVFRY